MTDDFPKRLQRLRVRRGISQRTLSERCGLSKNMIARYERGIAEPPASVIKELADFFEVSSDYLLGLKKYF